MRFDTEVGCSALGWGDGLIQLIVDSQRQLEQSASSMVVRTVFSVCRKGTDWIAADIGWRQMVGQSGASCAA